MVFSATFCEINCATSFVREVPKGADEKAFPGSSREPSSTGSGSSLARHPDKQPVLEPVGFLCCSPDDAVAPESLPIVRHRGTAQAVPPWRSGRINESRPQAGGSSQFPSLLVK